MEWKAVVFYEGNVMEFTTQSKRVRMDMSKGGHQLIKLEIVSNWTVEESINYLTQQGEVNRKKRK